MHLANPSRKHKSGTTGRRNDSTGTGILPVPHPKKKRKQPVSNIVSVHVRKTAAGPLDAIGTGGPNSKERALMWLGKPPRLDKSWHRRVYDMNEELAEYLSSGITIKVGCLRIRPLRHKMSR